MSQRLLAFAIALLAVPAAHAADHSWADKSLSPDRRADLVQAELTQDEKFQLIRSYFGKEQNGNHPLPGTLGSAGYVPAIPRLGLPALQESDAGLGVVSPGIQKVGSTSLPAGIGVAASFDPQVAFVGGAMIGGQARHKGYNVLLAGGINLVRDPRNGRNFEYAGEDPLLAGVMAGNAIRGVQSAKVISTIKHYAINALETGRNTLSADIDPVALRESDLLAFEIAIGVGDPGSVMCSYNRINATYACENPWLLNDVLKGDWGYKGFVMSDWGGVHGAATSVMAGLDQESAGEVFDKEVFFDKPLRAALAANQVPQSRIDDMVHRILRSMFAHGVIDEPVGVAKIDFNADAKVSQHAAEAGAVLLRNEGDLLPLSRSLKSVAVIGAHADKGVIAGGGSSTVTDVDGDAVPGLAPLAWPGPQMFHPSAPLKAIAKRARKVAYADGVDVAAAAKLAAASDVAVVFVTQWTAESFDRPDMVLSDNQDALVAAVAKANPHTVVVLENGGAVKMPWLGDVGAVLEAWYPGSRGGEAIARLLYGEVAPSGRLPMSWPKDENQLPRPTIEGAGLGSTAKPADRVDYNIEGADVGYRWFQRKNLTPLFPFGYGLTYTHFDYADFKVAVDAAGKLMASVKVTNSGKREGADVPQVYATLPGTSSTRRLVGWTKISLKPGESRRVEIAADPRLLARWDDKKHGWHVAAGNYHLQLGRSAIDFAAEATVALPESTPKSP
jgi:beta-glucosidase